MQFGQARLELRGAQVLGLRRRPAAPLETRCKAENIKEDKMQGILPTDVAAMQDRRMRVPTGGRARMQRMRGLYEHRCCAIRLSHTRGCARVFPRRRRRSSGGSGVFRLAALNCCKELLAREASGASEPTVWIGCIRSKYVCVWASTGDSRNRELWRARNRSRVKAIDTDTPTRTCRRCRYSMISREAPRQLWKPRMEAYVYRAPPPQIVLPWIRESCNLSYFLQLLRSCLQPPAAVSVASAFEGLDLHNFRQLLEVQATNSWLVLFPPLFDFF